MIRRLLFNDPATTEIYTLSLHDALPIFPSNLYPWKQLASRGVEVRVVDSPDERLDPDRVSAYCDSRTRIVAVSWVGDATGWRDRKSTRLNYSHANISYAVFSFKKQEEFC